MDHWNFQNVSVHKALVLQALSEREKNWEAERQRLEQEVEAIRRSSQKEVDNLRAQLQEARDSSNNSQQVVGDAATFQF